MTFNLSSKFTLGTCQIKNIIEELRVITYHLSIRSVATLLLKKNDASKFWTLGFVALVRLSHVVLSTSHRTLQINGECNAALTITNRGIKELESIPFKEHLLQPFI